MKDRTEHVSALHTSTSNAADPQKSEEWAHIIAGSWDLRISTPCETNTSKSSGCRCRPGDCVGGSANSFFVYVMNPNNVKLTD